MIQDLSAFTLQFSIKLPAILFRIILGMWWPQKNNELIFSVPHTLKGVWLATPFYQKKIDFFFIYYINNLAHTQIFRQFGPFFVSSRITLNRRCQVRRLPAFDTDCGSITQNVSGQMPSKTATWLCSPLY